MAPTVFHVTHWKAGSQWVRAVLENAAPDRIVPALPDQRHVFGESIVPGGIYTPVYSSHEQFRSAVPANLNQRTFVVVRDPRDTLVSWYYSLLYSHGDDWESIPQVREILQQVNPVDGLAIVLRGELYDAINIQMTWLQAGAKLVFYEDLLRDELLGFRNILEFCEIEIDDDRLCQLVAQHNFEKVSGRKRGETDSRAVLRKGQAGDWRNHFPDQLTTMFRTLFGEATVRMGYAPPGNERW